MNNNTLYGATVVASAASKNYTFLASLSCYLVINYKKNLRERDRHRQTEGRRMKERQTDREQSEIQREFLYKNQIKIIKNII